jgi:hypothetical protein
VLEALVLRSSGVLVLLTARQNEVTDQLLMRWNEHFERVGDWSRRRPGVAPVDLADLPREPGAAVFEDLPVCIEDDLGTDYQWRGSQSAGTGTPWDSTRWFAPAVPAAATKLSVFIATDETRHLAHRVRL